MSEELLTCPESKAAEESSGYWTVVARNDRVNRSWKDLIARAPSSAARCYEYLRTQPTTRYPGRVFPLRGKQYAGAWEYEVTGGDRVYYVPESAAKKVVVYFAGEHPRKAPTP